MKAPLLLLLILWTASNLLFGQASIATKTSGKTSQATETIYAGNTYITYRANPKTDHISMHWKDSKGEPLKSISRLKIEVESKGDVLIMATNAGMYTPENAPLGLYVEEGKELRPIDLKHGSSGNFYMQPNGVFLLTETGAAIVPSLNYDKQKDKVLYATQSGPMLVTNGEINSHFTKGSTNTNIRSGVGINDKGEVVFVISKGLVNFYEFAMYFQSQLHCYNALYLDGAISRMYLPSRNLNDTGGNFGAMIAVTRK